MDVSRVGLTLSTTGQGNSAGKNSGTTGGKAAKQQYVTVQEGDYLYTYLVIGDHIRVLIGRTAADKEDDEGEQSGQEQDQLTGIDAEAADRLNVAANQTGENNKRRLLEYASNMDVETFLQCRQTVMAKQHA
ncbi:hypothetical protein [Acetonema longum]|uniref:Uncharacterized protein n=1 Tax=Acetonema longum DSM 6540 TaxID=1009370 RepID=F7NG74_9FIRM|nr:hypothetical protein [Acetonema longum]EGO64992.1 hypothetical protein ALO_05303 [Acetonema longum DSM 6540]